MELSLKIYVLLLLIITLSGCVGYVNSHLEYVEAKTNFKSKEEVIAAFGNPNNITRENGKEVWHYYIRDKIISGKSPVYGEAFNTPASSKAFMLFLVIIPIMHDEDVEENARFILEDEKVIKVLELRDLGGGYYCSAITIHPFSAGCHKVQ